MPTKTLSLLLVILIHGIGLSTFAADGGIPQSEVPTAQGHNAIDTNHKAPPPPQPKPDMGSIQANKLTLTWVIMVLSVTGSLGGLAASLDKGAGVLQLPKTVPEKPGTRDLGFLADVLLGLVAANSVQLAVAAFLDYNATTENFVQKIMSLVALGLVAGFAGPKVLSRLANQLLSKIEQSEKKIDALHDSTKQQKDELKEAKEDVKNLAVAGAERALEDPLLSERQDKAEKAHIAIAAKFVESAEGGPQSPNDLLILAYRSFQDANYVAAAAEAERASTTSPPPELLWKIYNLLGLCYHWQQPDDWKPGGDMAWFDKSKRNYDAAIANKNTINQEMLSKDNLCFLYLDAEKFQECEDLADAVVKLEAIGGIQVISLCDLARIASAASRVSHGDSAGAIKILNETKNIAAFEYLFNGDDLKAAVIKKMAILTGLKTEAEAFLKMVVQKL